MAGSLLTDAEYARLNADIKPKEETYYSTMGALLQSKYPHRALSVDKHFQNFASRIKYNFNNEFSNHKNSENASKKKKYTNALNARTKYNAVRPTGDPASPYDKYWERRRIAKIYADAAARVDLSMAKGGTRSRRRFQKKRSMTKKKRYQN